MNQLDQQGVRTWDKVTNSLKIAWYASSLVIVVYSSIAHIRRHKTHEIHSQRCPCFSGCFMCIHDGVKGNSKSEQ